MLLPYRVAVTEHTDRYSVMPDDQFQRACRAFEWCQENCGPMGVDWCFHYTYFPWVMSFRHAKHAIEFKLRFL